MAALQPVVLTFPDAEKSFTVTMPSATAIADLRAQLAGVLQATAENIMVVQANSPLPGLMSVEQAIARTRTNEFLIRVRGTYVETTEHVLARVLGGPSAVPHFEGSEPDSKRLPGNAQSSQIASSSVPLARLQNEFPRELQSGARYDTADVPPHSPLFGSHTGLTASQIRYRGSETVRHEDSSRSTSSAVLPERQTPMLPEHDNLVAQPVAYERRPEEHGSLEARELTQSKLRVRLGDGVVLEIAHERGKPFFALHDSHIRLAPGMVQTFAAAGIHLQPRSAWAVIQDASKELYDRFSETRRQIYETGLNYAFNVLIASVSISILLAMANGAGVTSKVAITSAALATGFILARTIFNVNLDVFTFVNLPLVYGTGSTEEIVSKIPASAYPDLNDPDKVLQEMRLPVSYWGIVKLFVASWLPPVYDAWIAEYNKRKQDHYDAIRILARRREHTSTRVLE